MNKGQIVKIIVKVGVMQQLNISRNTIGSKKIPS